MIEITNDRIKSEVETQHPEIRPFLERTTIALYSALWVGDLFPKLAEIQSAASKVLAAGLVTENVPDVQVLDTAVALFLAAYDDAWFEADLSGAGYEVASLRPLPKCQECGGIERFTCICAQTFEPDLPQAATQPLFWAMRQKDGHLDHLSLRHSQEQCVQDFEASFGQDVTPEYMSGWEAVQVRLVAIDG